MKKISFAYIVNCSILCIISILMFLPMLLVITGSFTDEQVIIQYGFSLIPKKISLDAYKFVLNDYGTILNGYRVTITVTVLGTLLSLFTTTMLAYCISRKEVPFVKLISFLILFTMLFSGGMVPWYIIITKVYQLKNTLWALVLPPAISPFYVFLMRSFFVSIPKDFRESAIIDGASEMKIFIRIMLPLAVPGLATVGLFTSLIYWNDWWHGLMLIDLKQLYPLQLLLRKIISTVRLLQSNDASSLTAIKGDFIPSEGVKMVTCLVTLGPIVFVYPFVQKYFIKGITLGGLKG